MSSRCVLCDEVENQQELAERVEHILEDQGHPDTAADIDWLALKRQLAHELALEGTLTLTSLRRHVYEHIWWAAA